ncbi:MAG: hypothetical protein UT32_C0001G0109 [Parcubacteria group bacterium GW2011_GWC2_39_14]|nr:MAG: hypothetical protein UT32_C0001G0109 [Parcubacteria group bacterium GW2011_GWC2_39_14]KKR55533.1 MAG: hypothetical protein UT91_C0001G0108 [Parcubacteria group bacterium GW2011_GWA2_40_23]
MNINIRRAIALAFIIAFFITAPLLIFYTAGFRYNFKKAQVQRTGTLIIKTTPKSAQVSLNSKVLTATTPIRENNVLPDEYEIKINKAGYYPWQKKLDIRPQETTFIEDVLLFPQSQSEKISDNKISFLSFSPGGSYALFETQEFEQDFLYLLNLNNFRQKLIFNNDKSWKDLSVLWAEDDSKALIKIDDQLLVATTIFPQQKIDLQEQINKISTHPTNLKWNEDDSNILYWQDKNIIYELNVLAQTNTKIHTNAKNENFNDFLVKNNEIYLIENINGTKFLTRQKLDDTKKIAAIELKSADYNFDGFVQNHLLLFEKTYNTLFIFNPELDRIIFNKENVQAVELANQKNYLSIITKQEISYIKLDESELRENNITRYSDDLGEAHWAHSTANYLFSLQNKKISALELDNRDKRFTLEFPIPNIEKFIVNSNDAAIIFLQDSYLYQLPISE